MLGPIPQPPANDWVSEYVDSCEHNDMISDTFGDEDTYYDPQAYFENTVNEIAEKLGMSVNGVLSVIHRVKDKFSRNLFIITHTNSMTDDEMADALNTGKYNDINRNDFLSFDV